METEVTTNPLESLSPVDQIREILFSEDVEKIEGQLKALEEQFEKFRTDGISKALPEALDQQVRENEEVISASFAPIIGKALTVQICQEKEKIVDALYPVIGSTVAKYMAESLKELTESINRKLESRLSIGAFMRKAQAKLTGVSEAELLFHKSLGAQFQSIFLIHKTSGILVSEAHSKDIEHQKGDMVAGMFSAISTFVEQWISTSNHDGMLDTIDYGDMHILFEKSGSFIVAAVTRGQKSVELRRPLQKLLGLIHSEFADDFEDFSGDFSKLPPEIPKRVATILSIQNAEARLGRKKKKNRNRLWIGGALVLAFLLWSGFRWYQNSQAEGEIRQLIAQDLFLKNNPILIEVLGDKVIVSGAVLNTALKGRIEQLLMRQRPQLSAVDTSSVKVMENSPMEGLLGETIEALSQKAKNQGFGDFQVRIDRGGRAFLSGYVSESFSNEAQSKLRETGLVFEAKDQTQRIDPFIKNAIFFANGAEVPESVGALVPLKELIHSAPSRSEWTVWGIANSGGSEVQNRRLARKRGQWLKNQLVELGMNPARVQIQLVFQNNQTSKHPLAGQRAAVVLPAGTYE